MLRRTPRVVTASNEATVDTQVIVVGAGPVGLMLAGELRLGGADVVVVERLATPMTESRASTLHARTMEMFDQRGLLERLGAVPSDGAGHFGGIPLDFGGLPSRYPGQWKVPQTRVEELLGCWAGELGADVRRGHELRGVTTAADHVEADVVGPEGEAKLRAAYLVGCDGEDSTVRRLAGFDVAGSGATRELLRADVAGIAVADRRFERRPRGLAIAARRPDSITRVMVHEFGQHRRDQPAARPRSRPPDFSDVVAAWARVCGEDISRGSPIWVNAFGDARRQVTQYRKGRILLAGDAAHVQMPIGGQSLNLGLADAGNLGWKLAAHVRGRAPAGLLDSYHAERHPAAARVLANVGAQAILLFGDDGVQALREVLGELMELEQPGSHLAGMISGLDVRYQVGPGEHALLGARLPYCVLQTPAGPSSTAELLRSAQGMLLDLSNDGASSRRLRATAAHAQIPVVEVAPEPGSPLWGIDAVLVRPDGHVAWVDGGTADLSTAVRWWLPRPARDAAGSFVDTRTHNERNVVGNNVMGNLVNKTALVTGSSRGIGRAIAERLARDGALVVVHYWKSKDAAEEIVASIKATGGRAFAVRALLGVPGDVDILFEGVEEGLKEHTGEARLDILVNNAGIMGGVTPEETTPELFDRLVAVNAKAPLFIVQRALSIMADGGRVINISSGLTRFANPQEIAYAMTKAAVEMIGLHYARHLASRGITVNSVAPGVTNNGSEIFNNPQVVEAVSRLSAFGRVGDPADVAGVVAFLASDDARWVTGTFIDATGGTLLGCNT
jgi:bifunctional oxygenase/reductase